MATKKEVSTIWERIDEWASDLQPWQQRILTALVRKGALTDSDLDKVFQMFLEEHSLATPSAAGATSTFRITGRPQQALAEALQLSRLDGLRHVNALPDGSALTFAPGLTVIYGRNGAGKSGFARLFANACFSRNRPEILGNIFGSEASSGAEATFHLQIGNQSPITVSFGPDTDLSDELQRISFFDVDVAYVHISETSPVEFRPNGFDVFPSMARTYSLMAAKLDEAIASKQSQPDFSAPFIGVTTEVKEQVDRIASTPDLKVLRELAVYGPTEKKRFKEVEEQEVALKARSPKPMLAQIQQSRADIASVKSHLGQILPEFASERVGGRNKLVQRAQETAQAARTLGLEQFKRSFFRATGGPAWEEFARAARALGHQESAKYPTAEDRCLLCERPFDDASRKHVTALLAYVQGDIQRQATAAAKSVEYEADRLASLPLEFFARSTRAYDSISRHDPAVADVLEAIIKEISTTRSLVVSDLKSVRPSTLGSAPSSVILAKLAELDHRLAQDAARLASEDQQHAIDALELERQTIRHREVLSQMLPKIEGHLQDREWVVAGRRARLALNPRHITEKEKELFAAVVGHAYKERFREECEALNCDLPIEMETSGERGRTMKSLSMKGHAPASILSEGEQKAIALADFLAEVNMNPAAAGVVLDDPVTSQDHERKELIADRLVEESQHRQVIIFTHDLPFLNALLTCAEHSGVDYEAHWVDRDGSGRPGSVTLNDAPHTSKHYAKTDKAKGFLAEAQSKTATPRQEAIMKGMGALRRTVEETVVNQLLKGVVPRWTDRVIVTGLKRIAWDDKLAAQFVDVYEDLSKYIDAHSHTDEAMGAPPEMVDLETAIDRVNGLIKQSKPDRERR